MARRLLAALFAITGIVSSAAGNPGARVDSRPTALDTPWDPARVAQIVDQARQARRQGDLVAAEWLCYTVFETVDRDSVVGYDAYADLLKTEHRAEEATVRAQAARLRELRAHRADSKGPTSTYLGFAPSEGLSDYAELLQTLGQPGEAERMRSLALAYRQVQVAHLQRSLMFSQGRDMRGAC
jgi:hypothetical protein